MIQDVVVYLLVLGVFGLMVWPVPLIGVAWLALHGYRRWTGHWRWAAATPALLLIVAGLACLGAGNLGPPLVMGVWIICASVFCIGLAIARRTHAR